MARIDWALLCESAFLDRYERVCVIGVATRLPVPALSMSINQVMRVARIVDGQPGDEMHVGVAVATPRGFWTQPREPDGFEVEQAGE